MEIQVVTVNQCGTLIQFVWIEGALLRLDELLELLLSQNIRQNRSAS